MEVSCTRITILISRLAHSLLLLPPSVNSPPLNAYMDPNPPTPTTTDPPPHPLPRPPPNPYEYGHKLCTCGHTFRKIHSGGAWILTSTKRSHESKTSFMNSPYYWRGRARGRGAGSTTATEFRERWRAARRARGQLAGHGSTNVSARMANLRRERGGHGHGHGRARGTVRTRDSDAALPTQASDNAVAAHGTVAPGAREAVSDA
ncbi:hypothetical protein OH76DRAFT_1089150 [Lentinus brumalis]|uniref:C2H2-type domain-containing protein n=1 Tax=Lentinus brumalis TaxID=2498619 RepID=A0A371CW75_9APHY|nr:hypothetical protein OH76DRAFT_1089150 [Polyporus brumalis]